MFHYFKIPYITCTFFTIFIYNEYVGPCFLLHVFSKKIASAPPFPSVVASGEHKIIHIKFMIIVNVLLSLVVPKPMFCAI